MSETVSVYSVVGRFLEHSRIYYFENGGDPEYYVGSADWMTRNLDNRVEAVTPVEDPRVRSQLRFVLEVMMADNRTCWEMQADGTYTQRRPDDDSEWNTQQILMEQTLAALRLEDSTHGVRPTHPAATGELLIDPRDVDEGHSSSGSPALGDGEPPPEGSASGDSLPDTMAKFEDRWYVPDSEQYRFAVRTPDGDRKYRKTAESVVSLLVEYYGEAADSTT